MNEEQRQTIEYYQTHYQFFLELNPEELQTLSNNMGEYFSLIQPQVVKRNRKDHIKKDKSLWKIYQKEARNLTKQQDINSLPDSDKPRAVLHSQLYSTEYYVIDHKISIWFGYKNNIPIEEIAHLLNLRWITSKENAIKGTRCL